MFYCLGDGTETHGAPKKKLLLAEKLFIFFMVFNISHRAMSYLLSILAQEGLEVPSSVYMLQKNKRRVDSTIETIKSHLSCGGKMVYLSIYDNIEYLLNTNLLTISEQYTSLKIKIGIDGLPLFKSSPVTIWPILCILDSTNFKKALPIAAYVGLSKPDFTGFVEQLYTELLRFKEYVEICGFHFKITSVLFICDAPARSFLTCTKGHSGYNACLYCRIPGLYCNNKVVFPYLYNKEPRTDYSFKTNSESCQVSLSPLVNVVSFVDSFPPEYMHSVCQGVVKRLLTCYLTSNFGTYPCKLSSSLLRVLDEKVCAQSGALPSEFSRKIRSLSNLPYFKATEFRTLLLYTGPYFLKGILSDAYYEHFLLLHFSIYVFCSDRFQHFYPNATVCLENFVLKLGTLFSQSEYTYNSHIILHLSSFVHRLGMMKCMILGLHKCTIL